MKHLLVISLILLISNACVLRKKWAFTDIGDAYYSEYDCKKNGVEIYRSSVNDKKLHGRIIRTNSGLYDSTLHYKLISTFHRGRLNGIEYLFQNDEERAYTNYILGIKQGQEVIYDDSIRITSMYKDGVIHGTQNTYVNDWLVKKSHFNHGIKDSLELYYDSLDQLATTIEYYFDYDSSWYDHLYLPEREFVSFTSFESLDPEWLQRAEYRGSIAFYSYDPKGVANPSVFDVVDESILNDDHCDFDSFGYFYVVHENDCVVCDYIDFDGVWIAYVGVNGSFGVGGLEKVEWFLLD